MAKSRQIWQKAKKMSKNSQNNGQINQKMAKSGKKWQKVAKSNIINDKKIKRIFGKKSTVFTILNTTLNMAGFAAQWDACSKIRKCNMGVHSRALCYNCSQDTVVVRTLITPIWIHLNTLSISFPLFLDTILSISDRD